MEEGRRVKHPSKSTIMVKPNFRKVQVVYYVSKNGQLEHPHIVEVTYLVHHQLRLKDVLERLSVLRGRGMPSLYSWSCKRMYKNGYVWNDLGENDVICPSDGEEFVLKASQLVHHSPEAQIGVRKSKQMTPKRHTEFNQEELDFEAKRTNAPSRCSREDVMISTHEMELLPKPTIATTLSPPSLSTTSGESNSTSKRFEDGDPYNNNPTLTRNSVLLHLMACGGSMGFKAKTDHHPPPLTVAAARKSSSSSSSSLHKGVLCKAAVQQAVAVVEDEICCMSENPRFGNLQRGEREYFSGSIVETMTEERVQVEPILNKSSSYKEERRSTATMAVAEEEEDRKREKAVAGKCIPKRFCSKPTKI
ncbi:protein UPSTREAM OF FLC [Cynara cardunculus var. scolymus]|uniref:protein UPSTREAM OF FLC n=1 Tax=Cynara cardunculus var. scolymus TaxID=59895 RepID=UPI000D630A63|nr:protein UPSTREAM OF FLC [Cynara cardunculus var. scolymus]